MHNDTPAAAARTTLVLASLVPAAAFAALLAALIAPRGTPLHYVLLAAPIITLGLWPWWLTRSGQPTPTWSLVPLEISLAVFGAYIAINALWAADRGEAIEKVVLYALFAVVGCVAVRATAGLDRATLDRLAHVAALAILAGACFLAIEIVFGQPIKRAVTSLLPFLRPPKKHTTVEAGWVTEIHAYVLNRNFGVLSLVLWPALLMLRSAMSAALARTLVVVLLAVSAIGIFMSEHQTSMMAIVAAGIAYAGMWVSPRVMRRLVLVGWVTATLLVVPIAAASYSAGLYKSPWIFLTARNRIVLWGVTAHKVAEAPLLGVGIGSTKLLDEEEATKAAWPKDHPYPLRTGRHSHNVFMQTWYELGAVGAALLLVIGVLALRAMDRFDPRVQPYAFASFVSAVIVGCFSWGLWQPWFMAAFGIAAVLLVIAAEQASRKDARDAT